MASERFGGGGMKFRSIEDRREIFPVRVMCSSISMDRWIDIDVMSGSKAGYYAWRGRPESPRKAANRALPAEICRVHAAHRGHHGAPRIHVALRAGGIRQAAAAPSGSCVSMA